MLGQKAGELPEFRFTTPEIVHRERFRAFQALDVSWCDEVTRCGAGPTRPLLVCAQAELMSCALYLD